MDPIKVIIMEKAEVEFEYQTEYNLHAGTTPFVSTIFNSDNVEEATAEQITENQPTLDFFVEANTTRMHPNLSIATSVTVTVRDTGELIVV